MKMKYPNQYLIPAKDFEPAYMSLFRSGELAHRRDCALSELENCQVCPRHCGVDRLADESSVCKTGRYAQVSSYFPHLGEEDCLRGWRGSGTIFFAMCNLRCVFCQNYDISQRKPSRDTSPLELAEIMLELQSMGCHNINFVTPEHVVPQVLEALLIATQAGLRLPIVYNTSAYDSLESLRLLDGIVDIYMPDFKIWNPALALRYLKAKDYPEAARQALIEMHRQVGVLRFDENGIAKRGVLVRHLVMPEDVAGTGEILTFLATELATDTYVNIMAQYRPTYKVTSNKYSEINRPIRQPEYDSAVTLAENLGLRLDKQQPRRYLTF
jgi:putative pyruvate formate lyase activating enzyme